MLDFSWFLLFILITVTLSMDVFPQAAENPWPQAYYWIVGITTSLVFFASLIAHEVAHSIVSKKAGIPVKSITLFLLGGVAQISREASKPRTELAMAIAGPLCSAALGGIFYGLSYLFDGINVYLSTLCAYLSYINLALAVFNMLPGFPMDGGRVLRSIVWMVKKDFLQATRIATTLGVFVLGCLIAFGIYTVMVGDFGGLMLIFIGFYLISAARLNYQQLSMREHLKGYTAQDVINRNLPTIPRNLNLLDLIEGSLINSSHRIYLVTDGDNIIGILTPWQIRKVPQGQWSLTTVAHIMIPVEQLKSVGSSDEASTVFEKFDQLQDDAVVVLQNSKIIGIITRQSLFDFAQRLRILKG